MTHTLAFVTSNKGKFIEAQDILGVPLEMVTLDIAEIQSLDLADIALHKAKAAFERVKRPLIVDDAGLFVDVWQGFPGPFVAHIKNAGGMPLMLQMLSSVQDRRASFKAAVGYHDGEKIHIFEGEVAGSMTREQRGEGWGFEAIFQPEGYDQTFAQFTEAEKNRISHRGIAMRKLKNLLK